MRKSLFTMVGVCSFLFTCVAGPAKVLAANCQDLLANNLYRCRVNGESTGLFEDCFQFTSPGVVGSKFDLTIAGLEGTLECGCKATGSVLNPKFNASTAFLCGNAEFGDAFEGKVSGNGKKISKGQVFLNDDPDESFVFECVLDPTCSAPALTGSRVGFSHRH